MALYYSLPVYKLVYDLILKVFEATKDFSKEIENFILRCYLMREKIILTLINGLVICQDMINQTSQFTAYLTLHFR